MQGAEINEAKKVLATEATALLHGREKAEAAAKTAQETFEQGATSERLADGVRLLRSELAAGLGVLAAFVKASGCVTSNSEARRQIREVAVARERHAVSDSKGEWLTPRTTWRETGVIKLSLRQEAACAA